MHMADALLSPAVGGTMLAVTMGGAAYSIKNIQNEVDEAKIPLMGVVGAFVFAAQMINFAIPGTGSSGHIGGGMLLSILLGPYAGFLTMASILLIQALFFGDGGLLAYGANVFNLGFFTCFMAYPFIYKWITKKGLSTNRIVFGTVISAVVGLQFGSFSVVLQTLLSGKTELPFTTFLLVMQPIHLAIGIVEGLVTAAVVTFVWKARPEIIEKIRTEHEDGIFSMKKLLTSLVFITILIGGGVSLFASENPDGLEWSIEKTAGSAEMEATGGIYDSLANLQAKVAFLPDYSFKDSETTSGKETVSEKDADGFANVGTSLSGVVGGALTLGLAILTGFTIHFFKKKKKSTSQ